MRSLVRAAHRCAGLAVSALFMLALSACHGVPKPDDVRTPFAIDQDVPDPDILQTGAAASSTNFRT